MSRDEGYASARLRIMAILLLFALGLLVSLSLVQYFVLGMNYVAGPSQELPRMGTLSFRMADLLVKSWGMFAPVFPVLLFLWGWAIARRWAYVGFAGGTALIAGTALAAASLTHLLPLSRTDRYLWGGLLGATSRIPLRISLVCGERDWS